MRKKILFLICVLFISFNVYAEGEATIKNIKVNGRECTCNGYDCSIEVDAKNATVTYEMVDTKASVDRLSGFSVELISQNTLVKIIVTNDEGEEKIENTYNISIDLHETSGDYSLKSLKVNDNNITLQNDVYVYSYEAKYDDEVLKVIPTLNDNNAKIITENMDFEFPIERSSISVDFTVKAENGDTKEYRIVVKRGNRPDTTLKSLKLDKGNISFDKDKLEYDLTVEYSVNDLIIEAIASSDKATVKIEKEDLVVGENVIKIIVTNEEAVTEYILNVTREPNMDKSLANLSKLNIKEYSKLGFKPNVLDYKLNFDNVPEKLTITAISDSSDGKVEIIGNENLSDGSKIVIKNTLIETGITREYTLVIEKNVHFKNNKTFVLISLIIVIIMITVMAILDIKDKKKKRRIKLTKILDLKRKKEKVIKKDDDLEII